MPVAVRNNVVTNNTNNTTTKPNKHILKIPQARVLAALMPEDVNSPSIDWPLITRANLNTACGYSQISTGVTRPMQGIPPGSSSGNSYPGLIALKYVEEIVLDIEGVSEINYRITPIGAMAYLEWSITNGKLPELRDKNSCINDRYKKSVPTSSK